MIECIPLNTEKFLNYRTHWFKNTHPEINFKILNEPTLCNLKKKKKLLEIHRFTKV